MTPRRLPHVLLLLALWLPLVWTRFHGSADGLPVQARVQATLAGRMARLVDLGGAELPAPFRARLDQEALALVDGGLEHRPHDPFLLLRRSLLAARSEGRGPALRFLEALEPAGRSPVTRALEAAWRGTPEARPPLPDPDLSGYYRVLALRELGLEREAGARLEAERERVGTDRLLLQGLAAFTALNLGLGLLAWLAWPWLGRVLAGTGPDPSARWNPFGAAGFLVAYQWLGPLAGPALGTLLRTLGASPLATLVAAQVFLYGLALGALRRLLPRLAPPPAPLRARLGLQAPGPRQIAAGVVGFWMALPAVLAASWCTSRLLDRSPFSSNPALELLLKASPAELAALVLLVAAVGPFFEEVLFRGVLFSALRRAAGPWGAGAASALVFALAHGDLQALLVLATLGALFALLYERTGSLWPSVLAHGLWNGATVAAVLLVLAGS